MSDKAVFVGAVCCFGVAMYGAFALGDTWGYLRATRACAADIDSIDDARIDRERRRAAEIELGFCMAELADVRERLQLTAEVGDATPEACNRIWRTK